MNHEAEFPSAVEPVAVLGAGELIAHLCRNDNETYRFSMFRLRADGTPTHRLRETDLRSVVKLCQVLAFAVVDDGWLTEDQRAATEGLSVQLDELTRRWDSTQDAKTTCS